MTSVADSVPSIVTTENKRATPNTSSFIENTQSTTAGRSPSFINGEPRTDKKSRNHKSPVGAVSPFTLGSIEQKISNQSTAKKQSFL